MNLVKWFRKNNKKVMAVVVIVIMVGFIGGSALQRLLMGGRTELHKTVAYFGDNRKITNEDLLAAYRELQVLRMLQTDTALRSIQEPIIRTPDLQAFLLGELLFSDRRLAPLLISRIRQIVRANRYRISDKQINDIYRRPMPDNIYWLLLKNEAELAGIRVPNEHAGKWLARNIPQLTRGATYSLIIRPIVDRQGVPEDEILTTFSRLLGVLEYARMVCSGEDTTGQQVMHGISQEGETIDVEFVRFDSSVFAEAQDEPMEQEILAHFDKHKRFFAGEVSEENPRGFGYKLAGRVQLEYIAVKLDDISGIVATPTQEEAEEYYLRNREQFTVSVTPDPNDPDSPTERTQSYAEVAAEIPNLLLQKRIDTKAAQILQEAKGLTEAGLEGGDAEAANLSIEELEATAGDYETARQILRRALRLAPDDLEALSCLGWAQTLSRDYDGAVLTYQHVLVVSPDDVLTRLNLGFICLQKGIYGEAIEHLSRAVRSAADRRAVLYGRYYLGLVYLAREMYNDAESFFLETVDLGPTLSEAYFQLGRARCQVGRRADAVSAWKDGAAAGGFDPWARRCAEAARRVESGQPPDFDPSSPAA